MSRNRLLMTAILVSCATTASAEEMADAPPAKIVMTEKGEVLADSHGMTLYVFDKDVDGRSNCNGQCASNWPPLAASANDKPVGEWTIMARDDGSRQWVYRNMPIYRWIKDKKPNDITGDGAFGLWHVAKP